MRTRESHTDTLQVIHTAAGEDLVVLPRLVYEALLVRANEATREPETDEARTGGPAAAETAALPKEVSAAILRGDSRLKAIRRWKNMTQLALSQQTGLSQGYLSDLENGHRAGTPETIAKLAEVLNVPIAWLSWPELMEFPGTQGKAKPDHRASRDETSSGSRRGFEPSALSHDLNQMPHR